MNIIGINKENDSYRPWNICPGYTVVTEDDGDFVHPLEYLEIE